MEVLNQKIIIKTFSHGGDIQTPLMGTNQQSHSMKVCVRLVRLDDNLTWASKESKSAKYEVRQHKVLYPTSMTNPHFPRSWIAEDCGERRRYWSEYDAAAAFDLIGDQFLRLARSPIPY